MRGTCHVLFVFDAGFQVDLARAAALARGSSQRGGFRHRPRSPSWFEPRSAPLRLAQPGEPVLVGDAATSGSVELALYDFGALTVRHALSFDTDLAGLAALAEELYENASLREESRRRAAGLVEAVRPAIAKPELLGLVEDYVVWELEPPGLEERGAGDLDGWLRAHALQLARILRSERGELSTQEVEDALSGGLSYTPDDAVLVDWNAALVILRDPEDVRTVLEFANVELLEMRFLDDRLDVALDRAQEALQRRGWRERLIGRRAEDLVRIGRLQADAALLFEGVNSSLKLIGDQYLARVYRRAAARFHLPEWDASILRKLSVVDGIYQKLADEGAATRMEILEWIIILLFVVSILVSLPGLK